MNTELYKLCVSNYKKCDITWNVDDYVEGEKITSKSLPLSDNIELSLSFSFDSKILDSKSELYYIPVTITVTGFKRINLTLLTMTMKLPNDKIYETEPIEMCFDTCDINLASLPYNYCSDRIVYLVSKEEQNKIIDKITSFKVKCTLFIESTLLSNSMLNDMLQLFSSCELSDVKILCEEKEFKVHKSVLAARSPVFCKMLAGNNLETNSGTITIKDTDPCTLEVFLKHLYSEDQQSALAEHTEGILYLATKYCVPGMIEECFHLLRQRLTPDRVLNYFILTHLYGGDFQHPKVVKYVCKNIKKIVTSDGWENLKKVNPIIAVNILEFLV